jgi:hypothetical protein
VGIQCELVQTDGGFNPKGLSTYTLHTHGCTILDKLSSVTVINGWIGISSKQSRQQLAYIHTCLYIYCNLLLFMLGPTEHNNGDMTITIGFKLYPPRSAVGDSKFDGLITIPFLFRQ